MAEVLLFHHARGLTPGVLAFASALRAGDHTVHTPDLYEGRTFESLEAGVAHADELGFETIVERGRLAASELPADLVYAGISLGVMPAQCLVQTRAGAVGALFLHSAVPLAVFGDGRWPSGVPLQIHTMENDDWGDVDVAREVVSAVGDAVLFLYPGDRHLFTDSSLPDYDPEAAASVLERALSFLAGH